MKAWWSESGRLVVDGVSHTLRATPNCRLVTMDGKTFEHTGVQGCPFPNPPLSSADSELVGWWSFFQKQPAGWSDTRVSLKIESDRNGRLEIRYPTPWTEGDIKVFEATSYFTRDAAGAVHATQPDGTEDWSATITKVPEGVQFCQESECLTLT